MKSNINMAINVLMKNDNNEENDIIIQTNINMK
jgi:hypothetical protein